MTRSGGVTRSGGEPATDPGRPARRVTPVLVAGLAALVVGLVGPACTRGGGPDDGRGAAGGGGRAGPDDVALVATDLDRGSFSVPCDYSHSAPDDPIVHHGHGHVSHRHDFFGATSTDSHSTAETLLAGDTTCQSVADRSAYWAPGLTAGGRPVNPTHVVAYYRAPVGADARQVQPLPNGLEMIAGDATATTAQDPAVVRWSCGPAGPASPVPFGCEPLGPPLQLTLTFPACWDGENLGSDDHRSHVSELVDAPAGATPEVSSGASDAPSAAPGADDRGTGAYEATSGADDRGAEGGLAEGGDEGGDGMAPAQPTRVCPDSHPVMLPEVTVEVRYAPVVPPGGLSLASGPLTGGHGDVLVAWDEAHLASEIATCVRTNVRCDAP